MSDLSRESKEATHQRFYAAFHDWFMQASCDFWSECDAPESLASIAVKLCDRFAAAAREAAIEEAARAAKGHDAERPAYHEAAAAYIQGRLDARSDVRALATKPSIR